MSESDRDYYRRRIAEEANRAERCDCAEIKGVHLELVRLYEQRLEALDSSLRAASPEVLRAV